MPKKDAATRAQEALDVAERRLKHLETKLEKMDKDRAGLRDDFEAAIQRRDYLAQNPDLPVTVENQTAIKHPDPEEAKPLRTHSASPPETEPEF